MVQSEALICLDAKHPDLVGALTENLPLECIGCFNYAKVDKVELREWKRMCKKLWRYRLIGQGRGQPRSRNKAWAACSEQREQFRAEFPEISNKNIKKLVPVRDAYERI